MKASPNREQQVFLIVGGVIFGLILVVVIYNMIQDPKQTVVEEVRRPLVVAPANRPSEDAKRPWIETVKPAPIFENAQNQAGTPPEQAEAQATEGAAPGSGGGPDQTAAVHQAGGAGQGGTPPVAAAVAQHPATAKKGNKVAPGATRPGGAADPIGTWAAREQVMPEPEEGPPPKARTPAASGKPTQTTRETDPRQQRSTHNDPAAAKAPKPTATAPAPMPQQAKASPQPAQSPREETADATGGYTVQLGSFSSSDRAKAVQEKVKSVVFEGHAMPQFQKANTVNGQSHYRVRLGPFASQKQAELAAQLVKRQTGYDGKVLSPGK
ncbi:MAG: SPOR domain-containing protein [Magnetococcus sp. DMHC-1]|nr:SPOR domain-containing protein [Magnetococcales bacterium]